MEKKGIIYFLIGLIWMILPVCSLVRAYNNGFLKRKRKISLFKSNKEFAFANFNINNLTNNDVYQVKSICQLDKDAFTCAVLYSIALN